ncbi:MAG TPA: zinc ribbon domain-containing protein [Terriglobia bacterium]|nr:zinc ribbon domain-containing protein [Terriglobia bacterium]
MTCPKCQTASPATARFCVRCHAPLRFTCPSCGHAQETGGKCGKCGVDFAKYAAVLEFQMAKEARERREGAQTRHDLIKQALLLPVTGGWSLLRYVKTALSRE